MKEMATVPEDGRHYFEWKESFLLKISYPMVQFVGQNLHLPDFFRIFALKVI